MTGSALCKYILHEITEDNRKENATEIQGEIDKEKILKTTLNRVDEKKATAIEKAKKDQTV